MSGTLIAVAIVIGFLLFISGFRSGWRAREIHAEKVLASHMQTMQKAIADETVHVHVERVDNTFLVYDNKTKAFLAQGDNYKEISEVLQKKHPGKIFVVSQDDLKKLQEC